MFNNALGLSLADWMGLSGSRRISLWGFAYFSFAFWIFLTPFADVVAQSKHERLSDEFGLSAKQRLMILRLESKGAKFRSVGGKLGIELSYEFAMEEEGEEFRKLVQFLERLPVTRLTIYGGRGVPKKQFASLLKDAELETLILINFVGEEDSLALISEHTSLTSLSIQSDNLTPEILRSYGNLGRLRSLTLNNIQRNGIDTETLVAIRELDSLSSLCLSQLTIDRQAGEAICQLESLENLSLVGCLWESDSLSNLFQLKNVHSLVFNDCRIDSATAEHIGEMSNVNDLYFYMTDVDDEKFESIMACLGCGSDERPFLRLDLSGTQVTEATLEILADRMPCAAAEVAVPEDLEDGLPKLPNLNWRWNPIRRNARSVPQ